MKERPILFSGPMVRAILDGRKTQTRRVVKPQPPENMAHVNNISFLRHVDHKWAPSFNFQWCEAEQKPPRALERWPHDEYGPCAIPCPYGKPGDRLWVRETFNNRMSEPVYKADNPDWPYGWQPSIHMPRWASRITLEATGVRVERLQDISEEDALAEGIESVFVDANPPLHVKQKFIAPGVRMQNYAGEVDDHAPAHDNARDAYACLWDSLYEKRGFGWEENPWVWVVKFRKVD